MYLLGVAKLCAEPNVQQNGISANQMETSTTDVSSISVSENGSTVNAQSSEVDTMNGKDEPIPPDSQSDAVPESALEKLASQPETIDKYNDMTNDVKEMDMIAFKVFTPNFEQSGYVIGLVEEIVGRTTPQQQDYDLILQIMGKKNIYLDFFHARFQLDFNGLYFCCLFTAGHSHIEHLRDPTASDDKDIHIQINRMDIFNAKTLTL